MSDDIKIESYEKALKELEEILEKMENDEITVDELAVKVERATELLKYCGDKLKETEVRVIKVVKNIDS